MPDWFFAIPVTSVKLLAAVDAGALLLAAALLLPIGRTARRDRGWWIRVGVATAAGAAAGWGLVWLLGDAQEVFGVQLSAVVHAAAALSLGACALAAVSARGTRWWRKLLTLAAVPVFLVTGGLMVNEDFAYFSSLGDVLGTSGVGALALQPVHGDTALAAWHAPAGMASSGTLGTVSIPPTASGFAARDAWVWLPPAALVAHPPRLPVVIALSGQPGQPSDLFRAAHLDATLDGIARAHHGVAPIVVAPDQLGSPTVNPMCVDGALGNVATYITVDVRRWILTHEPVSTDRADWTIAGFSQGGTCAIQFGAEHPELFGGVVDVSGEEAPISGSVADTVSAGFGGSERAYRAACPLHLLAARRYPATVAMFVVGGDDTEYRPAMVRLAAAASRAGMRVRSRLLPQTAHDWHTASRGLAWGLRGLEPVWDLPR